MKKVTWGLAVTFLIASLFMFTGCGNPVKADEPVEPDEITLQDELPSEVQAWIDDSLNRFGAQTKVHEEILYMLVTYGEKPTGGFDVEITKIAEEKDGVVVTVHFTEPGEDDMVTQALTYPYDLAMMDDPGLPVEFIATGAETKVPVIK